MLHVVGGSGITVSLRTADVLGGNRKGGQRLIRGGGWRGNDWKVPIIEVHAVSREELWEFALLETSLSEQGTLVLNIFRGISYHQGLGMEQ